MIRQITCVVKEDAKMVSKDARKSFRYGYERGFHNRVKKGAGRQSPLMTVVRKTRYDQISPEI